MRVELDNLSKAWDGVVGADRITLDIADGDLVVFLGPSGCGKTTTLLMVAGIYKPTGGTIKFDGHIVNEVAPRDRGIGMVFQSYALYPHMTVFGNISYPLRIQKVNKSEIRERVQRVSDMMGIGHLLERKIAQLSGGQQQRVSLGRALVKEPQLLLFDEPLSNLDARLRLTMRGEIKRLQADMGITSIYVTHDQVEAMTMADKIAVMSDGVLQAYDVPEDLYPVFALYGDSGMPQQLQRPRPLLKRFEADDGAVPAGRDRVEFVARQYARLFVFGHVH